MANARTAQSSIQALVTQTPNIRVSQSSIQILALPALTLSCNNPPVGTTGQLYSNTFSANGGLAPYTWSLIDGSLPPGLTLNTATGVVSGTPTTSGLFPFELSVVDSSTPTITGTLTCSITVNALPTVTISGTLRFEIPKKRWFQHTYADPVLLHYLDETQLGSVDNLQLLMTSSTQGLIYRSGGDNDNNIPITSTVTTPAMDGGDDRIQKLYVDVMSDVDNLGSITATAQFNNQTVNGPAFTLALTGSRVQLLQNISSLSDLNLYRNITMSYQWTGGPDGPRIYVCEPSGYAQPYISTFFVTQFINLAFPGWKHHRRLYAGYISNTPILFTIKTQDGRTYGPYTLPSTGGQFKIVPIMLDQNIKDLAFAYQIDGGGNNFALFPETWTIEIKEWTEPNYIPLSVFKT